MQVISIDPEQIEYEIKEAGWDNPAAIVFAHRFLRRWIKITGLPERHLASLEEILKACNIAAFPFRKMTDGLADLNLYIAGSDSELDQAAAKLESSDRDLSAIGKMLEKRLQAIRRSRQTTLKLGGRLLPLGTKTYIMGILNLTPDSFSDGGRFNSFESAINHAFRMADEGADIIDIGGESTRPGHRQITVKAELKRVMPVIEALKKERSFKVPLSIDTYKAPVAVAALEAGVDMLNDVWGLKGDPNLAGVAALFGVPVCLMHNRDNTDYTDLIATILGELLESVDLALQAGVAEGNIIIDPGIGFGKNLQQNLEVMRRLRDFCNLGYPLLLGTSRKSMIGKILDLPVEERLEGTAATIAYGISAGADLIRVHDVKEMKRVVDMTDAMLRR